MKREDALRLARQLKQRLLDRQLPIRQMLLYGSAATGKMHEWSDIDIAIVCEPFRESRHEERMEFRRARRDIDERIEPISFHPEDLENKYSTIVQEVKKHGIPV